MSDEDDATTEVAGVELNWTHFVTGDDDATINNVSVLSSPREWHALGVGAAAGAGAVLAGRPEALGGLLLYVLGRDTKGYAKAESGHMKDALKEPVYATIGAVIGATVATLASPLF